jgi:hypothetical protein
MVRFTTIETSAVPREDTIPVNGLTQDFCKRVRAVHLICELPLNSMVRFAILPESSEVREVYASTISKRLKGAQLRWRHPPVRRECSQSVSNRLRFGRHCRNAGTDALTAPVDGATIPFDPYILRISLTQFSIRG